VSSGNQSPAGASARFPRFDGIGGIAAVMVIIYHAVFFTTWFGNAAASLAIPIVLRVRPFHHINVFQDVGVNVFSTFIGAFVVVPAVRGPQDEGRIRRLLRSRVLTFLGLVS
jgi:peptidoglycan/LPS O-acetylase OafA/YrhL